jgi:hypothetical protein
MLVVEGCVSPMSYHPGDTPHVGRVQVGGQYDLCGCGEEYPCYAYILHAGDPLGFERDAQGRLIGLADGDRFLLSERDYKWVCVSQASSQHRFEEAYRFLFEDILTPAFIVIGYLRFVPGVRP